MSDILPALGFQLGTGGIGGFIVGYAIKKISKLVAIIIGLFLVALIYLSTQGIISIDYAALWKTLASSSGLLGSAFSWLVSAISLLPFAASFIAGLVLGFKVG